MRMCVIATVFFVLLCFAVALPVQAVDFKARGTWQVGFGVGESSLVDKVGGNKVNRSPSNDAFKARSRIRQWIDVVASENLSGTLGFEIGHFRWGQASTGAGLGADGTVVKVRQAYIDFRIPETDIKTRMGIQNISVPTAAGGGSVLADMEMAAVVVSADINENFGVTAMWGRPYNDNYNGASPQYLDNIDLFMVSLPIKFDDFKITPWAMYGMQGKNAFINNGAYRYVGNDGGNLLGALTSIPFGSVDQARGRAKPYGSMFWAGLPIVYNSDPLNIEFEFNYGYVEGMGRYDVRKAYRGQYYGNTQRANTRREGWLVKALAEYKFDWGKPGIFGWYASGDDGNLKNGSERLPFIYAEPQLLSMLGDNTCVYGGMGGNDRTLSLDGTWGIGLHVKDISFVDNVKHLLRVAYVQGTNSTNMVKYAKFLSGDAASAGIAWQGVSGSNDYYLTTNDSLLEFDFHTVVQIYDNLKMGVEFDYVVNMIDKSLWKKANNSRFAKTDMWVADLTFAYSF